MKKTINIKPDLTPQQQQRALQENIVKNSTLFPKGVHIADIDNSVINALTKDFTLVADGEEVPMISILSITKQSEYLKNWTNVDNDDTRTPKLPMITIEREYMTKKGTKFGGSFNIPNHPTFSVFKHNVLKKGRKSIEYYQIPQPTVIDVHYKLTLFTEYLEDGNVYDELILQTFNGSQYYIQVNGHHMPLKLEGFDDESQLQEIEKRRFYERVYNLKLEGYILDEKYFKKLRSLDKIMIDTDSSVKSNIKLCVVDTFEQNCEICLNFKFGRKSIKSKTFDMPKSIGFIYDNQSKTEFYQYLLNNVEVTLPFTTRKGDKLTVVHSFDTKKTINIKICGNIL